MWVIIEGGSPQNFKGDSPSKNISSSSSSLIGECKGDTRSLVVIPKGIGDLGFDVIRADIVCLLGGRELFGFFWGGWVVCWWAIVGRLGRMKMDWSGTRGFKLRSLPSGRRLSQRGCSSRSVKVVLKRY